MTTRTYILLILFVLFLWSFLLRKIYKKEISETSGTVWIFFTIFISVVIFIPNGVNLLGNLTGVYYAPTSFLGIILAFSLFQNIRLMIQSYKLRKQVITLTQSVALIEQKIFKGDNEKNNTSYPD